MIHTTKDILHLTPSWKHIKVSELGELYISLMIKTLGLSLVGIFVPVYLYQIGYPIEQIALFFVNVYVIRTFTDIFAGRLIGSFGPKHIMIVSHVLLIISLVLLLTLPEQQWNLGVIAVFDALSAGFFFMAYHTEFSKLHTYKHAGHQLSIMFQLGRISSALGPLIGGLIAQFFGISYVILVAMVLIIASAIPLMMSPEPVKKHQLVTFRGFPWKKTKWDIISNSGLGIDQVASLFVWPLFISVYVFTDNVYLGVGFATSIGLAASIFVTGAFGRFVDRNKGGLLIRVGTIGLSLSHFVRLFVRIPSAVFLYNFVYDPIEVAYRMPYTKGLYDAASSHEGYRIAYIAVMMTVSNIGRTLAWVLLWVMASHGQSELGMQLVFAFAGIAVLSVLTQRYKALQ